MKILTLIFLIIVFQFLGCHSSVQTDSKVPITEKTENENSKIPKAIDKELERNRHLWSEKNILDYDMLISAYVPGNVVPAEWAVIKVRAGKAISIEPNEQMSELRTAVYKEFDSVNKMFDKIQQAFEFDISHKEAGYKVTEVNVTYNQYYGYPEELEINYLVEEDNYYRVLIKKFEIIE